MATRRVIGLGRVWAKVEVLPPFPRLQGLPTGMSRLGPRPIPKSKPQPTVRAYRAAVQGIPAALGDTCEPASSRKPGGPTRDAPHPPDWLDHAVAGIL